MQFIILCFLVSSAVGLSLLDLHDGMGIRTYSKDNVQNNADGTISFKEYVDYDSESTENGESRSIPLIEAPVAMSNPIWKIFSRASDLYRIFRRSYQTTSQAEEETQAPEIEQSSTNRSPRTLRNPRGWLFLR
uniref:Secreted protein n=1 Tax=Panagrellus redivivus TaxID=6233 RepID=A0A7E4VM21_PANRE